MPLTPIQNTVTLSSLLCNESVMNRSFLHSLANSAAIPQVPCMPACGHVLQTADELASANIPRAVERESAACVLAAQRGFELLNPETRPATGKGLTANSGAIGA